MRGLSDAVHAFLKTRYFYPLVFVACAYPLASLLKNAIPVLLPAFFPEATVPWTGDLGVNPSQALLRETGRDAFLVLLASLSVTPIRRLTGWNRVQLVRRTIGVWAFVYALCHFTTYVVFDQVGDVASIAEDVFKRRFIFVGMLAFLILLSLALTSTNGMMRRLGRRWQRLHRLVYVAAIAGSVHFIWGQKADIREPLWWATVLSLLLGLRLFFFIRRRSGARVLSVSH